MGGGESSTSLIFEGATDCFGVVVGQGSAPTDAYPASMRCLFHDADLRISSLTTISHREPSG